ncbi:MAG TPA: hypothetical protein VFK43_14115, partial [Acidimicrobiales bacterium]|nr:hypothetical protein [Acidimicrobiales bacterium]
RGRRERLLVAASTARGRTGWASVPGVYLADERPPTTPDADLDLHLLATGPALDQKVAALLALGSQTDPVRLSVGDARYADLVAEEAFVLAP